MSEARIINDHILVPLTAPTDTKTLYKIIDITMDNEEVKELACEACNFRCASKAHLERHENVVHKKIKDNSCKLCNHNSSSK